ncbi:MAG: prenyltransferase [Candidatus Bathyarchaeota archaeon]|nr:MAG: prenyltransferase [Candidatus Bathyarchaeota archaeon]
MLYLLGYLLAASGGIDVDFGRFVFGYLILGLAQLSVSFSNDYFDRDADRNSMKTVFSGGSKVLIDHPELQGFALKMALLLLTASIIGAAGFTITYSSSYWFFLLGVLGGLMGWFYTAPPLKFAYRGGGELVTMLAIGVLMPGIGYFAAANVLDYRFLAFVFPLSCYGLFFILTVELPDVESDTLALKTNIPVKWGRKRAKYLSVIATMLGAASLVAIHISGIFEGRLDLRWIAILSVVPLFAAASAFQGRATNKKEDTRQLTINMSAMILFICLVDFILMLHFFF